MNLLKFRRKSFATLKKRKSTKRKSTKRKSTKMFSIRKKHYMKGGGLRAILTEDDKEEIDKNEQVKPWMKTEIKAGMGIEHDKENEEFIVHVRKGYTIRIDNATKPMAYELFLTIYNKADILHYQPDYKRTTVNDVEYSDQGLTAADSDLRQIGNIAWMRAVDAWWQPKKP